MNNFKLRKISNDTPAKPVSEKAKRHLAAALGAVVLLVVIYWSGVQILQGLNASRLIEFFSGYLGKDLIKDEKNHTNILLLGVGGGTHDGADLTDTIIIASLNHTDNTIGMVSIPRDLYIKSEIGESRINRLFELGKNKWDSQTGLEFMSETIQKALDTPIHYYVKLDFDAFEQVVDDLDGIDIYVNETINDTAYPDSSFGYEPFYIEKGSQHLDGKTALKYVRSRHTSSDFDRSKRQQQVLLALKQKAVSENILKKSGTLRKLYYSVNSHLETSMSLREMISLADFASRWDSKTLSVATINDEPTMRGGFLYTPLRELYGGAYVLIPAGENFDTIKKYLNIIFYGPKNIQSFPITILNGTRKTGLAATIGAIFYRFGFNITSSGNATNQNLTTTNWYITSNEAMPTLEYLKDILPATVNLQVPPEYMANPKFADAKIFLELGPDSFDIINKLNIFKNIVSMTPKPTGTSTQIAPASPK